MKKRLRGASAVLLVASLLTTGLSLASCQRTSEPVLSFGNNVVTENQFTYYLATYKASFLSAYADVEDTEDFYAYLLPNGQTGEEYLFGETVNNVCMSLICAELFDRSKLTLDSAVTAAVDSYVQSFIDDYAGGDKRQLNNELAEFGLNVNMLRDIYLFEEKGTVLFDHLYGENGTIGVTEEELDAYYRENYARIRHIYVNNSYAYETTADGYTARDENGNYITRALTDEELAAKNEIIAAIDAALGAGEAFDTVYAAYSEDKYYENGYYLTRQMDFIDEVETSAFELAVGEWTKVESDVGTHYIMRLAYDEAPWENEQNADFFDGFKDTVGFEAFVVYVQQYLPEVERNEELLGKFSIKDSPSNYRF